MKRLVFILFILFSVEAIAIEKLFTQANEFYANEKYQEAIQLYDSIQKNGWQSAELYFNMGNAYYKMHDWANSILYYEKALKLNPSNEDASYNLQLAQLKITDKIDQFPVFFYKKWWNAFSLLFSYEVWAILCIILIWCIPLMILIKRIKLFPIPKFIQILAFLFAIISFLSANSQIYRIKNQRQAIIFEASTIIKSAPSLGSNNLFTLHSGTKVVITDQIGEWMLIQISNGNQGWMLVEHCKEI